MRFVILGGSGSGKSTQAQNLSKHFDVPIISTGEILRQAVSKADELGRNAHHAVTTGELVPDELMIDLIRNYLRYPELKNGWVLEGYPRTAFQAEELDFLLDDLEQKLNSAIYLKVSESVMLNRSLERSQPDDQPEIVQRRVELFYDRTVPILEYYDRRHRLLTINGDQSAEAVKQNIISLVSNT
ncbi:MAG: nucleoside monophosphate kinase [Rivularia sp. ALOHA_DT_140]|nr:nucleoside monophosphate kinase [Rivularia sp. ALOHA_DT_140]